MYPYLSKFIIFLIAVMPLLAPIRPDIGWINATPESFKTAWGVFTVMIALSWWVYIQYKEKQIAIIKTPLYLPVWSFVAWSFVTLFWVEDGYFATIMLAQFVSSALIFTLIVNSFKGEELLKKIPKALVISMSIVTIVGLIQYYFPDNYLIQNVFAQVAKPSATFGNKNMASHFVVMVLPLSIVLLLSAKNNFLVAQYSVVIILGFWYLMNAAARQAWVAMAVELTILLVFILLDRYKNKGQSFIKSDNQIKSKFIATVGIMLSLVFVANIATEGSFHRGSNKLEFVKKIDVEGLSSRFPGWLNTIEMIKNHPITGVGVGQWPESYPLYYDRVMKDNFFNEHVRLERLHNDYLEILANFGLVGYGLLLWLTYLVVVRVWRILKNIDHEHRLLTLGLGLGLVGFSTIALVSFPVRVYLPAFLVLVYFSIIVLSEKPIDEFDTYTSLLNKSKSLFALIVTAIFAILISFFSYRWVLAEHYYSLARSISSADFGAFSSSTTTTQSMNKLKNDSQVLISLEALKYNNFAPNYYILAAEGLIRLENLKVAVLYLKKAIDISPFNTKALLNLALVYRLMGSEEDLKMHRKVLEFILSFDPKNVKALTFLAHSLGEEGRPRDAAIVYQRMKNNFEYFKGRLNFGPYHENVGALAVIVGDYAYAQYIYQDAIKGFPTAENYINLGMVEFDLLKNKDKGVEMYKKALELDPDANIAETIKKIIDKYESSAKQ